MERTKQKSQNLLRRKFRIKNSIKSTANRPRLTVYISNLHITAQVIDDIKHTTLVYVSTVGDKKISGSMTEKAAAIGSAVAQKAIKLKIKQVVLDRNGRLYHGRIKALADAARAEGLEF